MSANHPLPAPLGTGSRWALWLGTGLMYFGRRMVMHLPYGTTGPQASLLHAPAR